MKKDYFDTFGQKGLILLGQNHAKPATFVSILYWVHKLAAIAATYPFTVVVSYTYVLCICVAMSHQTKKRLE